MTEHSAQEDIETGLAALSLRLNQAELDLAQMRKQQRWQRRLRLVLGAMVAAFILVAACFYLIRYYQLKPFLAELRTEPGIEIFSVRGANPLKTRITGIRDPKANEISNLLEKHRVSGKWVDLKFTEFHSLNTAFQKQRTNKQQQDLEQLRNTLIGVVGDLSEENRQQWEQQSGRISQLLLELRFPEAMDSLNLQYRDGVWFAKGNLPEKQFNDFKKQAPNYVLNGVIDLDNLGNYTAEKTASLRTAIEAANLLKPDYQGKPAHAPRVIRLLREYDQIRRAAELSEAQLVLNLSSSNPSIYEDYVKAIATSLAVQARVSPERIRISSPRKSETEQNLYLRLIE